HAVGGIRDFHVTGVQTCALPIFGQWNRRPAFLTLRLETDRSKPGGRARTNRKVGSIVPTELLQGGPGDYLRNGLHGSRARADEEIGRASCREGVEWPAGVVALTT